VNYADFVDFEFVIFDVIVREGVTVFFLGEASCISQLAE